jgi:hypothetical protein
MNLFQRVILLAGLLVVTGFCLYPPYQWEVATYQYRGASVQKVATITQDAEHYWIWDPPQGTVVRDYSRVARIDWQRLSVYAGLVTAFCLFLTFVIFKNFPRQSKPSTHI